MKKGMFSMLSLCLIFTLGCRKDAMLDVESTTEFEQTREKVAGNHDLHTDYVKNFNKGSVKPRSTYYEIEESVELMNNGLNELYCRPGQKLFDSTLTYFDTVSVPVNGSNEIHEDDIAEAMDAIAEFAGDIYYARGIEDTSKVSCAFVIEQAGQPSGGTVDIGAIYIMQEGEPRSEEDAFPYERGWAWYYDEEEQETAGCAFVSDDVGAEDLYRRDLRNALSYQMSKTEQPFYYINLYVIEFVGHGSEIPLTVEPEKTFTMAELINPDDEEEEDNYYDFLVWSNNDGFEGFHECLTVDEMNFHYQEMRDLLIGEQPNETDVTVNIEVGYASTITGDLTIMHMMQGWYADKIPIAIGNEVPEDLPGS